MKLKRNYFAIIVIILLVLSVFSAELILPAEYSVEGYHSSERGSMMEDAPEPPENITVEHTGLDSQELIENGIFEEGYSNWTFIEDIDEGFAGWDEENYEEGGSIHVSAEQEGDGTTTQDAYWEQDIGPTSNEITVNAAYRRNISLEHDDCDADITIELLVNDTEEGWERIYLDEEAEEGDSEWREFGPDAAYTPTGEVNAVRAHMYVEAEGNTRGQNEDTAHGELWMDDISVVSRDDAGDDHNLLTWDASRDDPAEVSHYNIYRSEDRDGPWDEANDTVDADGSQDYSYLDENKGMTDDIYWWYVVRAVGENDIEENNTDAVQEPFEVEYVEITPEEDFNLTAGEEEHFDAEAYDEDGNSVQDDNTEFRWENVSERGLFNETDTGEYDVSAAYQDVTSPITTVTVEPSRIERIEINPRNENINAGEDITYTAEAYDGYGNEIGDVTDETEWSDDIHDSEWEDNELTPHTAGEWTVRGQYGEIEDTTSLIVEPGDPSYIEIGAEQDKILAGETITYYAVSVDEFDNIIKEVTEETEWSIEDGAGGSWTDNEYKSENPGEWDVTGTYSTNEDEFIDESPLIVLTEEDIEVEIIEPSEGAELSPEVTVEWTSKNAEHHEIRLNEDDWIDVGEETTYIFEDLEEGEHSVEVQAKRSLVSEKDMVNFTVESEDPHIEITSPDGGDIVTPDVTVEWTSKHVDYHAIRLNEGDWIEVGTATSYTFEGLEEREHMVEVRGVSGEGSVIDSVNFTVDPYMLHLEILSPEDDEVLRGPEVTVNWTSENAETHSIRLNEESWIEVGIITSYTFEDLSEGDHKVEVRAERDDESETDTVSFIVTLDRPELEIVSPEEGKVFNVSEVTVEWTSENTDYHEIKIEGRDWEYKGTETTHTFSELEDGSFEIEVRAESEEDSLTKSVTITIDTVTPTLEIKEPTDGDFFNRRSVMVEWQGSDEVSGIDYYEIQEDEEWIDVEDATSHWLGGLEEGEHQVSVRAFDRAGNLALDQVEFIIDTNSPEIEITKPVDDYIFTEENVTVEWKGDGQTSGIDSYELLLDGESTYQGSSDHYDLIGLEDDVYSIEVRAFDRAGNEEYDSAYFRIDTTPPEIEINHPVEGDKLSESFIDFEWEAIPRGTHIESYEVRMDDEGWQIADSETSHIFEDISDGNHTIEIRVTDEAEHSAIESVDFLIDTVPPEIYFISPEENEVIEEDSIIAKWNYSDTPSGINYFRVRLDDGEWHQVSEFREYDFTGLSDGTYSIEVEAVDNAGNEGYETIEFEIKTEEDEAEFSFGTSCLLPLLLSIIVGIVMIAGWYRWKESEREKLEEQESPTRKRRVMEKSGPSSEETSEPEKDISGSGVSEWREAEPKPEKKAETEEKRSEEPSRSEKPEKTLEELSKEEMDVNKLDVVEEFQNIKGIGSGIAHSLYEAGYRSMEELKEAKVDDIKEIDGIGLTQAELIHRSIQKGEEKTQKTPSITEDDLKAHELGPMVKGREMKKESELEDKDKTRAPHIEETDLKAQQIDAKLFEGKTKEDMERKEEEEISDEITKEESLSKLSELKGIGSSKAENLYENGFHTLDDLERVSKEELQEIEGIGPKLSEKILDSLEDIKD